MVLTLQMPNHHQQHELMADTADTQQKHLGDEHYMLDDRMLDPNELDSGLDMSPNMADSRRESFAMSSALFSPKTEPWAAVDMESTPSQISGNHFMEPQPAQCQSHANHYDINNPFYRTDQHQYPHPHPQPLIPQPTNSWSINNSSPCSPIAEFGSIPTEFGNNSVVPIQRSQVQSQTPFSHPANRLLMFPTNGHHLEQSTPKEGWMTNLEDIENHSPIRSHNKLRRGDGIRKKNARFDIPAERTLNNIDALIAQANDEAEIRELKQQKRLLRNRQAALDSRQRKKLHTERLEDEKKQFTAFIGDLEVEMDQMRLQMEQMMREKQQHAQLIEELKFEKESLVRAHTIETGELRKKISVLTSNVQLLEGAAISQAHGMSNHSFTGANFGNVESMPDGGHWDDSIGLFATEIAMGRPEVKQEVQTIPTEKAEVTIQTEVENPATQGGLLFMLFLVGAFVLSSKQPNIPRVSEDMRAASASILENVLKDAGVAQFASGGLESMTYPSAATSWSSAPTASMNVLGSDLGSVAHSMLDDLSNSLMQPSQEQQNQQLFGLTSAQYEGVSSHDFLENASVEKPPTSQGRKNLAQALASLRTEGKAEVYTRSLLWDQIPIDVVRIFAKMVAESNHVY